MRKITQEAVQAFGNCNRFNKGNTTVKCTQYIGMPFRVQMLLHGNPIAYKDSSGLYVSCGGWTSNTTKERLNGILSHLGLSVYQKDFTWYFSDGSLFNTEGWNKVDNVKMPN